MAVHELAVAGRIDPTSAWERYADLELWSRWAPLIAAVDCDADRLAGGLRGTVRTVAGFAVPFEVEACDHERRRWRWDVRVGPLAMTLDHEVLARPGGGAVATLAMEGPWPLVTAYVPAAHLALTRLVAP